MSMTFSARLNRLFDTVYPPGRGPHTSAEVIAQKLQQAHHLISIRSVERVISDFGLQKKTLRLSP